MRSKIRLLLIISFLCRPILSSYSSGTVTLEWHAFTEAIKLSNGKSSGGFGHSFMKIHNEKNVNIQIGYYTLQPHEYVTIGLWTNGATGSSSSSSSDSTSKPNKNFKGGVLYNEERYKYTIDENMTNNIYTSMTLDNSDIITLTKILKEKNSRYNVITYNCATFTTDIWNQLNGTKYWTGWNQTPSSVMDDIDDYSYNKDNNVLTYTSEVYFYNESEGKLTYL